MACIMVYCPVHGFVLAVCGAACESLLCACCVRVLRVAVHCPKGHSYLELKVLAPGKYHYRLHSLLDKRSNTAAFRAVPCCAVFMRAGHFYLELKGLAPGKYHYKYIIDNTWAVDGLAPKVLDSQVGGIVFEGWGVCCVWVGGCHYQYIIDNTWAVDGLAPKVLDSQVNRNCLGRGGPLELGG